MRKALSQLGRFYGSHLHTPIAMFGIQKKNL